MSSIIVFANQERRSILLSAIEYVTAEGNYSLVHIQDEKPILLPKTLKVMENLLIGFIRIHKSTLVNPLHITSYTLHKQTAAFVNLSNKRSLEVSLRRYKALIKLANSNITN